MVINLDQHMAQTTISKQQAPSLAFPLSSPHHETLTTFKPANGPNSLAPNDAFLSPNPFASSSSDDESGSSSGQDEFHLERYSQDTHRTAQSSRLNHKQSRRRRQQNPPQPGVDKKTRPGLNVITTFSAQAKRSQTDGLLIDQVQSQRPQLGPRYATSIKSAKAEHMSHSFFEPLPDSGYGSRAPDEKGAVSKRAIARQAVSKLQDSHAARKRAAEMSKTKETMRTNGQTHPTTSEENLQQPMSAASGHSPGARSIVIGMSVPEDEVDAHRSAGGANIIHSANTPETPAIVITPADDSDSWKPPFFNRPRPPSSMYSSYARAGLQVQHVATPPVPRIPFGHVQRHGQGHSTAGAIVVHSNQISHQSHLDYPDSDDDSSYQSLERPPRGSTDSQERILPAGAEDPRHKSQGWWNLMLSPMLSRKGTIAEKGNNKSPKTPPVPSIPADIRLSKADVVSPLTSESPETPRRAGLASARASVWSRWTTWERERDGKTRSDPEEATHEAERPRDMVETSNQIPPMPAVDLCKGLAAEYYHACAVEQLTGVPYFECENHSCAENLPQLQSIFDKGAAVEAFPAARASRDLDVSIVGGTATANRTGESTKSDAALSQTGGLVLDRGISMRSEPQQLSPNVRQADIATVVKARAIETPELQPASQRRQIEKETLQPETNDQPGNPSLPDTESLRRGPRQPIVTAAASPSLQPQVLSPGPVSPAMQRTMTAEGAVPMTQIDHHSGPSPRLLEQSPAQSSQQQALAQTQPPSLTVHNNTFYNGRSPFDDSAAVEEARKEAMERLESEQHASREVEHSPTTLRQENPRAAAKDPQEAEKPKEEKQSLWSKLKHLFPKKKPEDAVVDPAKKRKTRRWTLLISVVLFLIVLACVLLATLLTRTGDGTPVQSQWLNLTGYPPIPTGISTIARPDVVKQQSKCVAPNTMWSCALPKEDQFEVVPNSPDQPNFRFQITFRNGSVPANMTIPGPRTMRRRSSMPHIQNRADDPFTNDLFTPNPSPPSRADQIFMGNTTDNITQPFDGEQTPFFITFIPAFPLDPSNATATASSTSTHDKRQSSNSSENIIPAPAVLDDGSAAPANLLPTSPFPTSQPLKLYNRGQADEHYGFYMYYDKAIFLHSTAALNTSEINADPTGGIETDDENGGSTRDQAQLRCTFSQTRFLVRMWTNPVAFGATLLSPIVDNTTNITTGPPNSATDFNRPGSFPYPTTITLDRHGGNINKKAVYCYGVDALQVIQENVRAIVAEFRGVEGTIINPAPALVNGTVSDDNFDQEAGGIDGGTGGCECTWQNWS